MKKVLLIMAAALMTMTQCRKQETVPATPSADTIKMTITAGPGAKTDITDEGRITWTSGDVLYVSDGAKWLGSLTLNEEDAGSASGTFTGNVTIGAGTNYHFFYLGKGIVTTAPTANTTTDVSISFASQDGSREGALKYHLGHGSADVTVREGEATGAVRMSTKIAIAHLKLTMDSKPYTGSATMDVSNTMTVSPAGSFSGSGTDGITIGGTSGDRYVTLIPTGTSSVDVSFSGSATGSMTFGHGIQANNLYGMKNGIAVTLEAAAPKFSVSATTTVEFSPGNLYWDGGAFHFETNQWGPQPTSDGQWVSSHVSHFYWSKDAAEATKESFNYEQSMSTEDEFFTNSSSFQVAGETAGTWRTLTRDEWNYLLGYDPRQWMQTDEYGRPNAKSLCAWKELDGGTHKGLVILPDGTDASVMSSISSTADLETYGAVFLPAAGYRSGTSVDFAGSYGYYWSGTPYEDYYGSAYYMSFDSGYVNVNYTDRGNGYSVRLVR